MVGAPVPVRAPVTVGVETRRRTVVVSKASLPEGWPPLLGKRYWTQELAPNHEVEVAATAMTVADHGRTNGVAA